jgi:hypothetical protein
MSQEGQNFNALTLQRLAFIDELVKRNGHLTQNQIMNEMNKEPSLMARRQDGTIVPIKRKAIMYLMKRGNFEVRKTLKTKHLTINDPECINNRYRYVRKYLELTNEKDVDLCFLGEFSFANGMSWGSCSPIKIKEFVEGKLPERAQDPKLMRNIQYLLVMSISGVVYF